MTQWKSKQNDNYDRRLKYGGRFNDSTNHTIFLLKSCNYFKFLFGV